MADDDIRDDGTVICAVHGMRYDPALADGCIRCPRSPNAGKRSAPPRAAAGKSAAPGSVAPPAPSMRAPASRGGSGLPPRPTAPPVPFEPAYLGTSPYQQSQSGPVIKLLPGPKQRTSRRGLFQILGVLVAGGAGTTAWLLWPEGSTDWAKKVTKFRYGPNLSASGAMYIPTAALERPCPLVLVLDNARNGARSCTRFAKHCEQQGWIVASSDAFGSSPSPGDSADATLLLEYLRANANVDSARAVIAGYEGAGEAACRLAILEPNVFAGAILESCGMTSWRDVGGMARSDGQFFLFTRRSDGSRESMLTMKDEMQRKGLHVTYDEMTGVHAAMERDELDPAFAWMESLRR